MHTRLFLADQAHAYRDAIGFTEGRSEAVRAAEIQSVWAGDAAGLKNLLLPE